jgi:hypothetical protein
MKRKILIFNFVLAAVEGGFCAYRMLTLVPMAKLTGYSFAYLFLAAALLALSVASLALAWHSGARPAWTETLLARFESPDKRARVFILILSGFVLGFLLSALPGYWFNEKEAILEQLRPLILWVTLVFGQVFVSLVAMQGSRDRASVSKLFSENKFLPPVTGAFLLFFLVLWIFIAVTRMGILRDTAYWNEAGVPILGLQIFLALVFSLAFGYVLNRGQAADPPTARKSLRKILTVDLLICLAIWGLSAGIWLAEPMRQSFNAPRPTPPYYEYYPFSDSISYDLGGQYMLIGQGINNNLLTDKPLYMFFLAILHAVGGQSVRVVIGLQVLVLAVFPVMLYLLGKEFHSRGAGMLIALLAVFKERNAIAAALDIQVAHSKLMMTEVPTALLISIITLLLFRWMKNNSVRPGNLLLWVGGAIGAAVLLRANSMTLLPLALLVAFLARGWDWRPRLVLVGSLLLGFSLIVSPWLLTNRDSEGRTFIQVKLDGVLKRYKPAVPGGSELQPSSRPRVDAPQYAMLMQPDGETALSFAPLSQATTQDAMTALEFIPAHFFHNQIAAVFILPLTWTLQDLPHTVNSQIWDPQWSGVITFENGIMLFLNLCLISLGLALAWRRWRVAGLIPALVEVCYFLANALARTSGSRYLVPVDWVIYFYYGLGLFQFADWTLSLTGFVNRAPVVAPVPSQNENHGRFFWITPMLTLLALGMLLPLSGVVAPHRYPLLNITRAYRSLPQQVALTDLGFDQQEISAFLKNPNSIIFQGRLLYPRYLQAGEGLCTKCFVMDAAFGIRPYPRLAFVGLGPYSAGVIVEMDILPANFRNLDLSDAPDVWVIGCKEQLDETEVLGIVKGFYPAVRGVVIAVSSQNGIQVYRQPQQTLTCE